MTKTLQQQVDEARAAFVTDLDQRVDALLLLAKTQNEVEILQAEKASLIETVKTLLMAINPPDGKGLSLHDWNKRLKAATAAGRFELAKYEDAPTELPEAPNERE